MNQKWCVDNFCKLVNVPRNSNVINILYIIIITCLKIVWEKRKLDDSGEDCLVSIDCTDFEIEEPTHRWKGWFSHKHNGPGVRYEIAVSLKRGHLVWIHGPFPCGQWPDVSIFRNCLKSFLDKNERVEADDGYIGEEPISCKTPGGFYSRSEDVDDARRRLRSRHETANARIKYYGICSQTFRHELQRHGLAFRAVSVLVQLAIENGEPLFTL